jgi:hypothetical protein
MFFITVVVWGWRPECVHRFSPSNRRGSGRPLRAEKVSGTVVLLIVPPVGTKRHLQAGQETVPDTFGASGPLGGRAPQETRSIDLTGIISPHTDPAPDRLVADARARLRRSIR